MRNKNLSLINHNIRTYIIIPVQDIYSKLINSFADIGGIDNNANNIIVEAIK